MTISGLDTPFDNPPRLSILSDQAVNLSSADDFAPDPWPRLLSYYRCCPRSSTHQPVNVSNIDKPTNRRSCFTSLSISSQTPVGTNTAWIHNPCFCYSYNFCHRLDMADCLKTMNQELLRPKDWVSPTVPDSKKEFAKLPTMDILMIGAALFNTLMQQASHTNNIKSFSISIHNIEKALAQTSTIDPAKKLSTEYHDFLDIFSQADSDILPPHRPYDYKIPLMEEKTSPWGSLYSMS